MYRRQPYGFKTCLLRRGFHIPIKNVRSPLQLRWDLTIHPLGGQRLCWHTGRCLALLPIVIA